jgi:hypothetical protein
MLSRLDSIRRVACALAIVASCAPSIGAQTTAKSVAQPNDVEYTRLIKETLSDPRVTTELVDHLPASATVPTPLKFFGHIIGAYGQLDYAKDMNRYLAAIAKASPRAKYWTIGKTEEGRDMVVLAIADEETIKHLDRYRGMLNQLTDPRRTTEAQAQQLIHTAKPIYWATAGVHSPERGGPEMLMELAYRLAVENTPFVSKIRSNVITFITPAVEVDGHEKMVDTYYYNKDLKAKYGKNAPQLPLMYWGRYVQHDNNRDGMGQYLKMTQNIMKTYLDWTPTVLHDLHEAIPYLYASTGTGPYNEALDPIVTDEWWILAKNDVSELTKRGVPGVWTYGFYDGWVPNYLFFIANSHNAIGRFYEVEGYGPDAYVGRTPRSFTSKEWFRPNPPLDSINWGPRANTNIQESALLFALHRVAEDHDMFMQNYWLKNKRSVEKGRAGPVFGWVIPAGQHASSNTADAVNELRHQGVEFNTASTAFTIGNINVKPGDYIIRADQPYRTLVDMYFSLQNYPPDNPEPYDDTGWTFPLMRNLTVYPIESRTLQDQRMTLVTSDVHATGGITGNGPVVIVDNTTDNTLITFRFELAHTRMQAAEEAFDADGHHFGAGAFVIQNADRAQLEPLLARLGLSGYATAQAPSVKMHELDVPRVALVHSWYITQEEGWVRAALDYFHVPYAYIAEPLLKPGNLRSKYDVIIYPNGGNGISVPRGDTAFKDVAIPYERSAKYPNLGTPDSAANVREFMGPQGMKALYEFVQQGGTLITEGGTAAFFPNLDLTPGVKVETPPGLFARGAIYRGVIHDRNSPLVYGYQYDQLPVYFNSSPVLNAGAGAKTVAASALPPESGRTSFGPAAGATSDRTQNTTPMGTPLKLSPWDPANTGRAYGAATIAADDSLVAASEKASAATEARSRNRTSAPQTLAGVTADPSARTRVVLQFPANPTDMLLSGTLEGGAALSNRAQLVDESIGTGHLVMFAIRPFWRWQTQGTFALGFNAILNWNHLSAGQ